MKNERGGKADPGGDTQPIPVVPSYQVSDKSSVPGKDPRTRS